MPGQQIAKFVGHTKWDLEIDGLRLHPGVLALAGALLEVRLPGCPRSRRRVPEVEYCPRSAKSLSIQPQRVTVQGARASRAEPVAAGLTVLVNPDVFGMGDVSHLHAQPTRPAPFLDEHS